MKHRSRTNEQTERERWLRWKSSRSSSQHTHTLHQRALSLSYFCGITAPTSTSAVAALYNTVTFVLFIFSFRLLAWSFLIATISFHLRFSFISFQTTSRNLSFSHSLSRSLVYGATSNAYAYTLHTYNVHTDRAGGLQPINMSERQRRIYIFANVCVCQCVCVRWRVSTAQYRALTHSNGRRRLYKQMTIVLHFCSLAAFFVSLC